MPGCSSCASVSLPCRRTSEPCTHSTPRQPVFPPWTCTSTPSRYVHRALRRGGASAHRRDPPRVMLFSPGVSLSLMPPSPARGLRACPSPGPLPTQSGAESLAKGNFTCELGVCLHPPSPPPPPCCACAGVQQRAVPHRDRVLPGTPRHCVHWHPRRGGQLWCRLLGVCPDHCSGAVPAPSG
jgi:hypothetical protein